MFRLASLSHRNIIKLFRKIKTASFKINQRCYFINLRDYFTNQR